ncbi:hypothetical protein HDU93_007739 [Gonapodya sp. JEL0774]|nr:hypothetical protein HDU93_007739 [Gonapodya sp. JEL0774]
MSLLIIGDELGTVKGEQNLSNAPEKDSIGHQSDRNERPVKRRKIGDERAETQITAAAGNSVYGPRIIASWAPSGFPLVRGSSTEAVLDKGLGVVAVGVGSLPTSGSDSSTNHSTPVLLTPRASGSILALPLPQSPPSSFLPYPYFPLLRAAAADPRLREEARQRLPSHVIPLPVPGPNAHKKIRGATWAGRGRIVATEILPAVMFPVNAESPLASDADVIKVDSDAPESVPATVSTNSGNGGKGGKGGKQGKSTDARTSTCAPSPATPKSQTRPTITLPALLSIDESGFLIIHAIPDPVPTSTITLNPPSVPEPLFIDLLPNPPQNSHSGFHRARISLCGTYLAAGGEELDLRVWSLRDLVKAAGGDLPGQADGLDPRMSTIPAPKKRAKLNHTTASGSASDSIAPADHQPPSPIFLSRSPGHDSLSMRRPVWITDFQWCSPGTGLILVGTAYGEIRVYDIFSNQRKPLIEFRTDPLAEKLADPPAVRCVAVVARWEDGVTDVEGAVQKLTSLAARPVAVAKDGKVKPTSATVRLALRVCWGDTEGEVGHAEVIAAVGVATPAPPVTSSSRTSAPATTPSPIPSTSTPTTPFLTVRSTSATRVQRFKPSCAGSVSSVGWIPPTRLSLNKGNGHWAVAAVGADRFLRWWNADSPAGGKVGHKSGIVAEGAGKDILGLNNTTSIVTGGVVKVKEEDQEDGTTAVEDGGAELWDGMEVVE